MHSIVLRWTDGQMDSLVDGENCTGQSGWMGQANTQILFLKLLWKAPEHAIAGHGGEQADHREALLFGEEGTGWVPESPSPSERRAGGC